MKRSFAFLLTLCFLTGCAAEPSAPANSIAANPPTETASSALAGVFDNTVFEQLCDDICIEGEHIPVPGYASDLGQGFSLRYLWHNTELHLHMATLEKDGVSTGFVYFDEVGEAELSEEQLQTMPYYAVSPDADDDMDFSVGRLHKGDTETQVIALLGEPDKAEYTDTSDWFHYYPDPGELMIQFKNGGIWSITVDTRGNADILSE